MTVEILDEGRPCSGPLGGRWHYLIAIAGRVWTTGERFFVLDNHKVPRPCKFMYHYTGNNSTISYSLQRFRTGDRRVPVGYVEMVPVETPVTMTETEMRVRQLAADLEDLGLFNEAALLLEAMDGHPDELLAAINQAQALIDTFEEAEVPE